MQNTSNEDLDADVILVTMWKEDVREKKNWMVPLKEEIIREVDIFLVPSIQLHQIQNVTPQYQQQ